MNALLSPAKLKKPDLFFSRLYYFTYFGGAGFINPFLNLFYVSLGLNGKQIGTFASTSAVVGLIAAPIFVSQIKKSPHARSLVQLILLLGALAYFLISRQTEFMPIVFIVAFQALVSSGMLPLSDSMAVSVARDADTGYGSIRVFGSLGWIFMVPASGWLIERLGGYSPAFWGTSVSFIGAAIWAFFISPVYFTAPRNQEKTNPNLRAAIRKVIADRTLLGFAIAVIAIGFLNSGVQQFENVFLSQLGATKQVISIAGILSAIVELPFMLLSDRIIRRAGPHRIFLVALLLTLLQRAAILIQPSITMIMIMRFVGGVGFSFYTIAFVGLINSRTQAHETGTVLALFTVTLAGLVNIFASPLAGALYDAIGARWLYAFSVGGYAIAIASLWLTRPPITEDEGLSHA